MNYLDVLNDEQRAAVQQIQGPVLIVAGPGSGKTRVLTCRIAYMIQNGVDPWNILSLTFTNKAAREMKERIENEVGTEARGVWMGTFHSIFARILRSEGPRLGFPQNFSIYDTADSRSLIKSIVKEYELDDKLYKPSIVHNRISSAKNGLIGPKEYQADVDLVSEDESAGRKQMGFLYETYQQRCRKAGAMDFDDLLVNMHELLERFPDVLYKYQQKFQYILIDEFQDTNFAQYSIVRTLGAMFENICAVGDDAQSIYAFRGANIANILNFERDYADLKVFRLEQNYRSSQHIVKVANQIIANNKGQLKKTIWTENPEGEKIKVLRSASDNEEGRRVADLIIDEKFRNYYKNKDFAILYRTNAQSRAFEESLRRLNIPYRVFGGMSFYQRKEIKDLIAYLRLIVNPTDEEAFRRVINYPVRGIGKTSIERMTVIAAAENCSLWDVASTPELAMQVGRAGAKLQQFATMIESFKVVAEQSDAYSVAMHVGQSTGILKELHNDRSVEGLSRYENIQELLNGIKAFTEQHNEDHGGLADLGTYLQDVTLLTDMDDEEADPDSVALMSLHSAKGLEFKVVFVVGLEENLFPSIMAMDSRDELEEERRLFYVGATRAMQKLHLSYATTRYRFGNLLYCEPSRFIQEIPPELLQMPEAPRRPDTPVRRPQRDEPKLIVRKPEPVARASSYTHQVKGEFIAADPTELKIGMKVEHQKFGFGTLTGIDGQGSSRIALVEFKHAGKKRIMLKFARLQIVDEG